MLRQTSRNDTLLAFFGRITDRAARVLNRPIRSGVLRHSFRPNGYAGHLNACREFRTLRLIHSYPVLAWPGGSAARVPPPAK